MVNINQIIKSKRQAWSKEEEEQLYQEYEAGKTINEMQDMHGRSYSSISMKLKRLKKKKGTYNQSHDTEKDKINRSFVKCIQPKSVLDLYSNKGTPAYMDCDNVYRNDKDPIFHVDSNKDALKCLCELYSQNKKFDLIDLDPYGSAYDCFDLSIKMANKGLCVTFGELGAKRWKRLDYVRYRYGFNSLEEFNLMNMISHVKEIGLRNKKELKAWRYKQWNQIGRVWFIIDTYKEYSQWGVN